MKCGNGLLLRSEQMAKWWRTGCECKLNRSPSGTPRVTWRKDKEGERIKNRQTTEWDGGAYAVHVSWKEFILNCYIIMYYLHDVRNMNKYRALVKSVHPHLDRRTAIQTLMKSGTPTASHFRSIISELLQSIITISWMPNLYGRTNTGVSTENWLTVVTRK